MAIQYAKTIPNLEINGKPAPYPVVNERSVRATAGVMFVIGCSAFWYIRVTGDYTPMMIVVPLFWLDFLLKAVFTPSWSIFGVVGRWLVRKQKPEYVGAIQKRFAWALGLIMASVMLILAVMLHIHGPLTFFICAICLSFMWLESACGICVGCNIYKFLLQKNIISKTEHQPVCPGGVCAVIKN